jgi:thymidylate synthase (FAD)
MQPSVKLLGYTAPTAFELDEPLDIIEFAGRWDYGPKSIAKMGDRDIIRRWIRSGEESMLEMVDVVFLVTCSRVVTHELVRHRMASYQQESQRYVKYDEEMPEDLFFTPPEIEAAGQDAIYEFQQALDDALVTYNRLKERYGVKSQIARYVLPNATRARIVVKMNLRELRHVLRLRMHSSAQPEMRDIATQMHDILVGLFPEVFEDIRPWLEAGERAAR